MLVLCKEELTNNLLALLGIIVSVLLQIWWSNDRTGRRQDATITKYRLIILLKAFSTTFREFSWKEKTILVVDDSEEIRDALSEYLGYSGFNVLTAADGDEMWQLLNKEEPNLIVLDIMLPGDDGLTLCSKIRLKSHIPIIMLTAVCDEADRVAGLEIGADDYITKTFSPRELLARIKRYFVEANSAQIHHLIVKSASLNGLLTLLNDS